MNLSQKKSLNKGFTLIELMVVISIISFLSSVVLGSLTKARINARDAQRISDIRQMRIALELYRNKNGTYPASVGAWQYSTGWGTLQTDLAPYIKLPKDPVNNNSQPWVTGNYSYAYTFDSSVSPLYDLVAQLENTSSTLIASTKGWVYHYGNMAWYPTFSAYVYAGEY